MQNGFVTVRELVDRQILEGVKLIAGFAGSGNSITWVNIMEILDEPGSLQHGELLITTGYHLEDESRYGNLISELKQRRISGIAVQLGYYIDRVPDYILRTADREELPVLVIPAKLTFSTILHVLMNEIRRPQQVESSLRTDQLFRLLDSRLSEENFILREGQKGYLFLIIPAQNDPGGIQTMQSGIMRIQSYLKSQSERCMRAGLSSGVFAFYLTLIPGNPISDVIFELTVLLTFLSEQEYINFFIGAATIEKQNQLEGKFLSAEKCCHTLKNVGAKHGVCRSQDLPLFALLNYVNRSSQEAVQGNFGGLRVLLEYDHTHSTNYVYTLRVYLAQEGSPSKTAARLFIHRHTLYKRLEKIREICGWDLNDYYTRTYLSVCLMLHDYYAL